MENFTLYTEVDPNSQITIASDTITWTSFDFSAQAYVYKDKGAGYFSGDFEHTFYINVAAGSDCEVSVWMLTNEINTYEYFWDNYIDSLSLTWYGYDPAKGFLLLEEYVTGMGYIDADDSIELSAGTDYYITMERDETVGTYGTIYCRIYSNAGRTVLVDTLSITLHKKNDFRYIFATNSDQYASPEDLVTGYIKDLDLGTPAPVTASIMRCDMRTLAYTYSKIICDFRCAVGIWKINGDLRTLKTTYSFINNDLRVNVLPPTPPTGYASWEEYAIALGYVGIQDFFALSYYDQIVPKGRESFTLYIDAVAETEVDLKSIILSCQVDDMPRLTFNLPRRCDNPDYNSANVYSQITNKNIVTLYFNGVLWFTGKITSYSGRISSQSDGIITVTAEGVKNSSFLKTTEPWTITDNGVEKEIIVNGAKTVSIPLTSKNEMITLYDAVDFDVSFGNKLTVSESLDTSKQIYKGIKVDLGKQITERIQTGIEVITGWAEFDSWVPDASKEYFFVIKSATVYNTETEEETVITDQYIGKNINVLKNNLVYQNFVLWAYWNYSYTQEPVELTYEQYISGDYDQEDLLVENTGSGFKYYYIGETELGYYYVGTAPYQEISVSNGIYLSANKYEEKTDGLYYSQNVAYNYTNYAKQAATSEYNKLDLLAQSSSVVLTLDAFAYYGINLIDKINITNTTLANFFKNANGFPMSIKNITIRSSSMTATLSIDTSKSSLEGWSMIQGVGAVEGAVFFIPESASSLTAISYYPHLTGKLPKFEQKLYDYTELGA